MAEAEVMLLSMLRMHDVAMTSGSGIKATSLWDTISRCLCSLLHQRHPEVSAPSHQQDLLAPSPFSSSLSDHPLLLLSPRRPRHHVLRQISPLGMDSVTI